MGRDNLSDELHRFVSMSLNFQPVIQFCNRLVVYFEGYQLVSSCVNYCYIFRLMPSFNFNSFYLIT